MSNSLDPDQTRHFIEPDLGLNCLQRLSTQKYRTTNMASLTINQSKKELSDNNDYLYSSEDHMEDWQSC